MQIQIRYFAATREIAGTSAETIEVDQGATVTDVLSQIARRFPRMERLLPILLPMVNQEYVERTHRLSEGDELALIPPVSGGAADEPADRFEITAEAIDLAEVEASVHSPTAGAIISFVGTVRNHARGREVVSLEYEAYDAAAEKMLRQIGSEIRRNWEVERIAIVHRTGHLYPGDASVIIAVSSPHRAAAFEASRHAIERIKEIVPVWKHEHYRDGSVWVGSEAAYQEELKSSQSS